MDTGTATLKSIYDADQTNPWELAGTKLPKSRGVCTQSCSLLTQQLSLEAPARPSGRLWCKPRPAVPEERSALSSSTRTSPSRQLTPSCGEYPQTQPKPAPTSCSMPPARGPARQRRLHGQGMVKERRQRRWMCAMCAGRCGSGAAGAAGAAPRLSRPRRGAPAAASPTQIPGNTGTVRGAQ